MEQTLVFKAIVTAPVTGPGYQHLWGSKGRGKPLASLGEVVLVKQWVRCTAAYTEADGHTWPASQETLYRVYCGGHDMFQLTEEKAKGCLRAMRSLNSKLVPVLEEEQMAVASAEEHFQYQMSR